MVSVPWMTLRPPSSSTTTSDMFGRKVSSDQTCALAVTPSRLVARSSSACVSYRFCTSCMRPKALMIRTPVAISSMIVVRSPC